MRLAQGTKLGPYEILAPLGAGGMGEVYRAHDTRLRRDVAIKVLPDEVANDPRALARFQAEARAVAALSHPGILSLFDIGESGGIRYAVTELLEGETLRSALGRDPLPFRRVIQIATQLAECLAAAHEKGIVHRDVKPENVFLTTGGRAKLLDFGLARQSATSSGPADGYSPTLALETEPGSIFGTVPYMAPEQLRGQAVDARADLFSLGVVLYEMAAGRRPFTGSSGAEIIASILKEDPPPLEGLRTDVPSVFVKAVRHCLEKDPQQRIRSAVDLCHELSGLAAEEVPTLQGAYAATPATPATPAATAQARPAARRALWWTAAALLVGLGALAALWRSGRLPGGTAWGRIDSLAVLPLANLSKDPEQEYFADGMTEALIMELSRIRALKVISRTSAMQYKNAKKPLPEIARALGVRAVVEGSVMREGGSVRITVQLIEAESDRHLWADSYTREARNVLALQSEVASAIARQIRVAVTPEEAQRLAAARPVDPEAHRLVLLGQQAVRFDNSSRAAIEASIGFSRRAIEKDPEYGVAYAALGNEIYLLGGFGFQPMTTVCAESRVALEKAIHLDPQLAEAQGRLAFSKMLCDFDWAGAEDGLKKALELAPGSAWVHDDYAWLLSSTGRHSEALEHSRIAEELDPLAEGITVHRGMFFSLARRHQDSEKQLRKVLSQAPDSTFAKWALGMTLTAQGRYDEAISTFLSRKVSSPGTNWGLGLAYGLAGRKDEARRVLAFLLEKRKNQFVPPVMIATVYIGLGEKDKAFEWLESACVEHGLFLEQIRVHPIYDPIRSDPRFEALVRRINVPG